MLNPDMQSARIDYVTSVEGQAVLEQYGFRILVAQ
jgi:hypothetical protein